MAGHCEVGSMLAVGLGMGEGVRVSLAHAFERWDGRGLPTGLAAEQIPWPVRVVVVARDVELFSRLAPEELADVLRARRARAYDPVVVDTFSACCDRLMDELDSSDPWQSAMAADPAPASMFAGKSLDDALLVIAEFTDLKSPWTRAHSPRVAELAAAATAGLGTHMLKRNGLDISVLLRANAVNYAVRGQDASGLRFGNAALDHPPQLEEDLAALLGDGVAVFYSEDDALALGISADRLIDGVEGVAGGELPELFHGYEQVWHW